MLGAIFEVLESNCHLAQVRSSTAVTTTFILRIYGLGMAV